MGGPVPWEISMPAVVRPTVKVSVDAEHRPSVGFPTVMSSHPSHYSQHTHCVRDYLGPK